MTSHNSSTKIPKRGWHCPPAERIAAYIDRQLSEQQRQSIQRHLADCAYCMKSVAGAMSDMSQPATQTPAWLRRKAEEQAGPAKSRYRRWAWAFAPVLASLLVAIVLMKLPVRTGKLAPAGPSSTAVVPPQSGAQAGGAPTESTRSIKSESEPLRLLEPAGGAELARGHLQFAWRAVPDATSYRIRVTTTEGAVVWETRSEQPHVQAPQNLKIAPGSYFAWVTAYLADGRELESAPVDFRVKAKP